MYYFLIKISSRLHPYLVLGSLHERLKRLHKKYSITPNPNMDIGHRHVLISNCFTAFSTMRTCMVGHTKKGETVSDTTLSFHSTIHFTPFHAPCHCMLLYQPTFLWHHFGHNTVVNGRSGHKLQASCQLNLQSSNV